MMILEKRMGLFDGTPLERPVLCDRCQLAVHACVCPVAQAEWQAPASQKLTVQSEKRKKGKLVTVIGGLTCGEKQRRELLTRLKNECGAGGTMDVGHIEIQGEHIERIRKCLISQGYVVK
jgi:translation initiation factor 1